jgi:transcriptional regulator with PAS, ATPase and Fis domain
MEIEIPSTGSLTLGRGPECDVHVDDPSVSRCHARLHVSDLALEDLDSRNGTFIGTRRVQPHERMALGTQSARLGAVVVTVYAVPERSPRVAAHERAVDRVHRLLELVARTPITVLFTGETGAGKEFFAERLHALSDRARGPLLAINCAALPENLLESELFGYERGAFTGAAQRKMGLLEAAAGGSVFLDEIGEMPPSIQAKVLRALESREVLRLGALKPVPIDVRFITATHRDLVARVAQGSFRQDLYYRLNGMTIAIPPLRERRDEIPELAAAFLGDMNKRLGTTVALSREALDVLVEHTWPGNIRELRATVERATVLAQAGAIRREHVMIDTAPPSSRSQGSDGLYDRDAERSRILEALHACRGNQTAAAQALGIARRTLINKIEQLGLPRPRKVIKKTA